MSKKAAQFLNSFTAPDPNTPLRNSVALGAVNPYMMKKHHSFSEILETD